MINRDTFIAFLLSKPPFESQAESHLSRRSFVFCFPARVVGQLSSPCSSLRRRREPMKRLYKRRVIAFHKIKWGISGASRRGPETRVMMKIRTLMTSLANLTDVNISAGDDNSRSDTNSGYCSISLSEIKSLYKFSVQCDWAVMAMLTGKIISKKAFFL